VEIQLGIDTASNVPRHRQVYNGIRSAILTGRLRPGDRLPPTRTLSERLSLSRATVAEAYGQLQAEGYLQGKHGSGTYVAPDLPKNAGLILPAQSSSPVRTLTSSLSAWGQRVTSKDYRLESEPAGPSAFRYDLRPHRIAQDSFPWDAWRSSVEHALSVDRETLLSYSPMAGHAALRGAIADHVRTYRAVRCSPDQVVIVNGIQQGLNLLAQLMLERGDRVAVEDPGYPTARLLLEARGLQVSRIPVDGEGIRVDALRDSGPHRMIHVTPSHQDPTGATLSLSRRLALLDTAESAGSLIIEDDYDSEFRFEGRPVESMQGLDRKGLVIYAGTFSKSVMASLRISFLILPPHLVGAFVSAKSLWDSGTPLLEQAALAQFILSGEFERHIRRMRRLYRSRRDALISTLSTRFGDSVEVGERHGGLNVLVALHIKNSDVDLVGRAASEGLGLRAASPYFATPPARPTFLLGFAGIPESDIDKAVAVLLRVCRL
jgi:GntR family transcriptional regulator/MocR family aminotransferase